MAKKKLLIFHPALAPYRVDQFNALSLLFELEVVFLYDNLWSYKMDQSRLISQLNFRVSWLLTGPRYKGRVFRYGMLKKIKSINPDIISGYEFSFTTQYLILLKRLGLIRQKIGSMIDDSIDICHHVQSGIRAKARKYSVKYMDFLVVNSAEVSLFYLKEFQLHENQLIISPLLQNPERLRSNSEKLEEIAKTYAEKYQLNGKKVLLFVGRFIPEKALPQFLRVICNTLHEQSNCVCIVVGEGPELRSLKAIILEKNLEEKVILPGKFEGEELYAWYLCASGLVLPSVSETFGAVVNEALIFGLKVLCSQYAGASCLIRPDNGLIFNPLNGDDTIEKLTLLLAEIEPVGDADLTKKPSLMRNSEQQFRNEWRKLTHD